MAEHNILNPEKGFNAELGFNPSWSYATPIDVANNMSYAKPRYGAPIPRESADAGHSFDMTFVDCSWAKVQRIKRFYEQFKRGYFTIIDWDGGGRHYVGRFTAPPKAQHTANLKWTIQGLTFEEIQGARMLRYPSDWFNDSVYIYAVSDADAGNSAANPQISCSTPYTVGWVLQQTPLAVAAGKSIYDPSSWEMIWWAADGNPTEIAQAQYVGYGFRQTFRLGSAMGQLDLYLDGILIVEQLDLYSGTALAAGPNGGLAVRNPPVAVQAAGAAGVGSVMVTVTNLPLGAHRVKVVPCATKNAASTGYAVVYPALQVMQ
jgi:hypothetical protein